MALGIRDLVRLSLSRSTGKWLILGGGVGVLCGVVGFIFHCLIEVVSRLALQGLAGFHPFEPAGHGRLFADTDPGTFSPVVLLLVLLGGGLLVGLLTTRFAPEARGGGNSAAVRAFHHQHGRIRFRVPLVKLIASALTIGTGGSAGREGPISQIGAGWASWFADRLGLTSRDRRILLVAGIAGGTAALFRAPLAAALFAAEVLYNDAEIEAEALIPSFISAIIAYGTFGMLAGTFLAGDMSLGLASTLFHPPADLRFVVDQMEHLIGYAGVAAVVVAVAHLFARTDRLVEARFTASRLPLWARPAAGAAAAGAIALLALALAWTSGLSNHGDTSVLAILGSGYGAVEQALASIHAEGSRWSLVGLFALIALGKMLATCFTVGSGGAGGVFGPSIVIGGCVGAAVGFALQGLSIAPHPAACTVMGMAGFLAATHRTPLAAILMVSEIMGTYHLLIPAMWVVAISFLLGGRRVSLISSQVQGPLASPAHRGHFFNDLLAGILVKDVMNGAEAAHTLKPGSKLSECRELLRVTQQTVFPVVSDDGRLVGEVTLDDLRAFLYDQDLDLVAVAQDVMSAEKWSVTPKDTIALAMRRFNSANVDELPIVEPGSDRFLGLLTRRQCIGHYNKLVDQLRAQRRAEGYDTDSDD